MSIRVRAIATSITVAATLCVAGSAPAAERAIVGSSAAMPEHITQVVTRSEYAALMLVMPDVQGLTSRAAEMRAAAKRAAQANGATQDALPSIWFVMRDVWQIISRVSKDNIHYVDPIMKRLSDRVAEVRDQSTTALTSTRLVRDHAQSLLVMAAEVRADAEAILQNPQANRATRAAASDALVVAGSTVNEANDFLRVANASIPHLTQAHRHAHEGVSFAQEFLRGATQVVELVDDGVGGSRLDRARQSTQVAWQNASIRFDRSLPYVEQAQLELRAFEYL